MTISVPRAPLPDTETTAHSTPTLADAISAVTTSNALTWQNRTPKRREDICSSLRVVARIVCKPPEQVLLDAPTLSAALLKHAPRTYSLNPKRHQNVIADLRSILRAFGISALRAGVDTVTGDWKTVLDAIPDKYTRLRLVRLARYAATNGTSPGALDDAMFDRFADHERATELSRDLADRLYRIVVVWNRVAETRPDLHVQRLKSRRRTDQYVFPDDTFPASFIEEVKAWCDGRVRGDVADIFDGLEQDASMPVTFARKAKPSTVALRRRYIMAAASALVHKGQDASTIRSLRDLVDPFTRVETIGRFHYGRRSGPATMGVFQVLEVLHQIAKFHVRLDESSVRRIAMMRERVRQQYKGIVVRNRERLRPLQEDRNRAALLHLPEELMRQAARHHKTQVRFRLAACATALEILLFCPLRSDNLTHLRLDRHFRRAINGRWEITHIVIDAQETKNDSAIDWPVPAASSKVLETWLTEYRPLSAPPDSVWFFPGRFNGPISKSGMRVALEEKIARFTGLVIHPHLMRHFAAMLFLRHNPGHYETVRRILGHRSLETTVNAYMPVETDSAGRRFDEVVIKERQATRILGQQALHGRRRLPVSPPLQRSLPPVASAAVAGGQ